MTAAIIEQIEAALISVVNARIRLEIASPKIAFKNGYMEVNKAATDLQYVEGEIRRALAYAKDWE